MKEKLSKLAIVFLIVLVISGVVYGFSYREIQNKLEPKEYITWINNEENGLIKNNTIEDYSYRCQYLPLEYFLAKYPNQRFSDIEKNKFINTISLAFEFIPQKTDDAVLSPDIIGHDKYSERLYYLNSEAKKDFKLVINTDTLNCMSLNYENPFSLSKNLKIMLEFDHQNTSSMDDFTLIYEDNLLGGGILKFHFTSSNLSSIPKLKTI